MTDDGGRWIMVPDDGDDAFGPYNRVELRQAILEDLIIQVGDEDDTPESEAVEYQAMTLDSLIDEYTGTVGARIVAINEPTAEWRAQVAS